MSAHAAPTAPTGKHVTLVGAPIEVGTGRRGCRMGADAFRVAGLVDELNALGLDVRDLGDLVPEDATDATTPHAHVKALAEVAGWTRTLYRRAYSLAAEETVPVYFGGDHSLALGTVAGHALQACKSGRPFFVLWLDAHADFNTFETTESSNLDGTPLAFACGQPGFEPLLGGEETASVDPHDVCILGLRSVDRRERELVVGEGIEVHDMRSIDEHGISRSLGPFLERVRAADGLLHVSLDVDFLEPQIAPAVGTTVPGGATYREAHLAMEMLHDSELVSSLDLVELNPFLDERGRTARLMVELVTSLFGRQVIDHRTWSY